jgi:hypothetical protein
MTGYDVKAVEATRARFRPEQIATVFVREIGPANGDFFYYGNNSKSRHIIRTLFSYLECHLSS